MTDDKHFNLWEDWVRNAYCLQEFSAFNTLWLAYFIAGAQQQQHIFKQTLKTVYTSLPDLIGILFLVRKYHTASPCLPCAFQITFFIIITDPNFSYRRWRRRRWHSSLLRPTRLLLRKALNEEPRCHGGHPRHPQRLWGILLFSSERDPVHWNKTRSIRRSRRSCRRFQLPVRDCHRSVRRILHRRAYRQLGREQQSSCCLS